MLSSLSIIHAVVLVISVDVFVPVVVVVVLVVAVYMPMVIFLKKFRLQILLALGGEISFYS